jgi:hypothetical protein
MMVQLQEILTVICCGELFYKHHQLGAREVEAEMFGA